MSTITEELINRDVLLQVFVEEARENLEAIEQSLMALERAPNDAEAIHTIFRAAHTLKGNAATVSLDAVVELGHRVEDLLDTLREGQHAVTPALITLLLRSVDALERLIPAAIADAHARADEKLLEALRMARETGQCGEVSPESNAPGSNAAQQNDTLRVSVKKLDVMMNLAGEIAIARGRLRELTSRIADAPAELSETQELLDRLCADLQDQVMTVRMVPVESAFQQQVRVARDLARAAGKSVEVRFECEDVELDTAVVEQIRNPLTHIVRNAVDHGIETPERRVAAGKPAAGTITLSAFHEAGMVVIRVTDDGSGLDRARIAARGRELGLAGGDGELSDEEIYNLVFAPGFSTAGSVSEISGRGVGMDVVHHNITALRGTVSIDSKPGAGTAITLRLPLTLAIIDALSVGVGEEMFVVPLDGIVECIDVSEPQLAGRDTGVVDIRGDAVPFVRLAACIGASSGAAVRRNLLLIQYGGRRAGVVVDRVHSRTQAVIKPLRKPLQRMHGVAGATILGDGTVALILDLPRLLRQHLKEAA